MKQLKSFLIFSVVCALHILISKFLLKLEINWFLIKSYSFLFLLSLFSAGCVYLLNKLKNKSPFFLLFINVIKIIACKNTLKDNQVRQQDKNNYLKFFNEKKHYYKNIEDNKLFIDRLNNLEVIGTVYSP